MARGTKTKLLLKKEQSQIWCFVDNNVVVNAVYSLFLVFGSEHFFAIHSVNPNKPFHVLAID